MSDLLAGAICFDDVSKRYRLGALGTLRSTLAALAPRGREDAERDLWAVRQVSFGVAPGAALGLIGPNGAGKTTVLRLLSKITQPTRGRIAVGGRISSLIELGAGFHPELSGRDNVFLNGAILGLSRRDIQRRFDAIVAFSELERFIDTPVKRYSSGMYVRLGFAVAAYVEPDVLLVDEVLAVGDAAFRQKCMARMAALRQQGTTLIFVSHNMHQVRRLCEQALLLVGGRPHLLGPTTEVIAAYEKSMQWQQPTPDAPTPGALTPDASARREGATDRLMIAAVELASQAGDEAVRLPHDQPLRHDQPLCIRVHYQTATPLQAPIVKVRLVRADGVVCALAASHHQPGALQTWMGRGELSVQLAPVQLATGRYMAEVRVADHTDTILLASGQSEEFFVQGPALLHEPDQGVFVPNAVWVQDEGAA